ncbi:Sterol desaturase/sphingolipid hydroxylase, fatty acid hydroxylase superfamily [Parafilimonas terrae]|uniref:Sterol desaturase/sphingolipid hydroxylase, fatty acid hydroxylase superfamily n=2 Tax=Parafilimonas terrae TaxID=1465490 RepID=A0A1I5SMW3_9BACT|nr:Sterol desaturase/sphingolipid hydroxylase, fatty acid hydroxylase superfamily [Parafilimonas terrae]
MEAYGKILLIAMPAFLLLVLFEKWYGWYKGNDTVRGMDMISSLSSGITNVTKDVLGLSITILTYDWLVNKIAIYHIQSTVWTYIIAFIVIDFAGYWVHRIDHKINIFWNSHLVHHSSEEFNLACALRQSISVFIRLFTFLLIPAALFGVPTEVIAIVAPIQLFAQFWYHTRHIKKMGILEKIIVTPSHHRVHHALNPEYIDKNLSQIFIIWDKIFGTFQEELPDKPPVYGITRPVSTWNPIAINFQHLWLLIKDAWRTKSWKDKLRIWFMPTGWRPNDVAEKYSVYKIEDAYNFEKYNPASSTLLYAWSWVQLSVLLLLISWLFGNLASIGSPAMFIYGAFIFIDVYAFTELMNRNKYALAWELIKCIAGIGIIYYYGNWFGADAILSWINIALIVYFIIALIATIWFVLVDFNKDDTAVVKTVTAQNV